MRTPRHPRNDRCPALRGCNDARQLHAGRVGAGNLVSGAERRVLLDVDEYHALDRADGGDHRSLPVRSAATSAVARRAAERGL